MKKAKTACGPPALPAPQSLSEADYEKFVELDRVILGEAQMEIARSFGEKVGADSVDIAHFALFRSADPTGRVTVTLKLPPSSGHPQNGEKGVHDAKRTKLSS